jgi:hypothetical protein
MWEMKWQMTSDSWKLLGVSIAFAFLSGFCAVNATRFEDFRGEIVGGFAGVSALMAYMSIMLTIRSLIWDERSGK